MNLIQQNIKILQQLVGAIQAMPTGIYATKYDLLSNSSLGMHVRHVIEFYECFLNNNVPSFVNYDERQRNMQLNEDAQYAIDCITAVQSKLEDFSTDGLISLGAGTIATNDVYTMQSSTNRELYYLLEHTVHHMAIVKMTLFVHANEVILPANFGVATSTINYNNSCVQ